MPAGFRIERDTMGEMKVPDSALYGAQTARAVENFPISSLRLQRPVLHALGLIKAAAARVNGRRGWLEPGKASAIERAPAKWQRVVTTGISWWMCFRLVAAPLRI